MSLLTCKIKHFLIHEQIVGEFLPGAGVFFCLVSLFKMKFVVGVYDGIGTIIVILHYTLYNGAESYAAASPNPEAGASPKLDTPATAFGQVDRNVG